MQGTGSSHFSVGDMSSPLCWLSRMQKPSELYTDVYAIQAVLFNIKFKVFYCNIIRHCFCICCVYSVGSKLGSELEGFHLRESSFKSYILTLS